MYRVWICDQLFDGFGLYCCQSEGGLGDGISGSCYADEFCGGFFTSAGDGPTLRLSRKRKAMCLGGAFGSGIQRNLFATGFFFSGTYLLAVGVPWIYGIRRIWVEPECMESDGGICSAEHGAGRDFPGVGWWKFYAADGSGWGVVSVQDWIWRSSGTAICAGGSIGRGETGFCDRAAGYGKFLV